MNVPGMGKWNEGYYKVGAVINIEQALQEHMKLMKKVGLSRQVYIKRAFEKKLAEYAAEEFPGRVKTNEIEFIERALKLMKHEVEDGMRAYV